MTALGLATYPPKKVHQRARPFLVNGVAICTPDERELLETDGIYPSGHCAIGWGWALILSQLAPEKAEALLARGRAYACSRMVFNVHWMSYAEAGMAVGAAAFARLQNNELFQATTAAARAELSLGINPRCRGLCAGDGDDGYVRLVPHQIFYSQMKPCSKRCFFMRLMDV